MRTGPTCILVSTFVLSAVGVAFAAPAWRARAEPPLEFGTFELGEPDSLPLRSEQLTLVIDGQHARATVDRVFSNETGGRVEGVFEFAVGESAKVTGFSYWNGNDRIVGEVLARGDASQIYDTTVGRRRDPGLLEEVSPGVFTFRVYPIEPRERKRVEIVYDQWIEQHASALEFRTPVGKDTEISIDLRDARGIVDLKSPTHALRIDGKGEHLRVTATARGKQSQLLLRWKVSEKPMTLHSWTYRKRREDPYVVLSVAAPPADPARRVAKDVTLVLDESGSMNGEALDNGKRAAAEIVRKLGPDDRINVILFDDRNDALFDKPEPVTAANRREAIAFLESAGHGGGTDIAAALAAALQRQGKDTRPKSILLITDGESNREAAAAVIARDRHDVRLFTVGIGAAPDRAGLTRLAETKRGKFTHIDDAASIGTALAKLYDRIEAPAFVDLQLASKGGTLARVYPETLPDLSLGDELVIVARVRGKGPLSISLTGRTANGKQELVHRLDPMADTDRAWVGAMWARARIDDLLVRLALDSDDRQERIDEVVRLGKTYDVVTPYTAFLAIPESELDETTRVMLNEARGDFGNLPIGSDGNRDFSAVVQAESAPVLASRRSESDGGRPERRIRRATKSASSGPHAGCAHCSVDERDAPPFVLVVVVAWLARRRHRRATP